MRDQNPSLTPASESDEDSYVILPISDVLEQKSPKTFTNVTESRVDINLKVSAEDANAKVTESNDPSLPHLVTPEPVNTIGAKFKPTPTPTPQSNPCAFFTNHKTGLGIASVGLAAVTIGLSCI